MPLGMVSNFFWGRDERELKWADSLREANFLTLACLILQAERVSKHIDLTGSNAMSLEGLWIVAPGSFTVRRSQFAVGGSDFGVWVRNSIFRLPWNQRIVYEQYFFTCNVFLYVLTVILSFVRQ
jgi:hypothetical protein